jgi:hypothetical protein
MSLVFAMPPKSSKSVKSPKVKGAKIAAKAHGTSGKLKGDRLNATGLTSRTRGHVSARGKRAQAKRDSR